MTLSQPAQPSSGNTRYEDFVESPHTISVVFCPPDSDDLYDQLETALEEHLDVRIENMADDLGNVCIQVTHHEDELAPSRCDHDWWVRPANWGRVERLELGSYAIEDVLDDPRWSTHQARAIGFRVRHAAGCHDLDEITLTDWIVEFSDQPLDMASDERWRR